MGIACLFSLSSLAQSSHIGTDCHAADLPIMEIGLFRLWLVGVKVR